MHRLASSMAGGAWGSFPIRRFLDQRRRYANPHRPPPRASAQVVSLRREVHPMHDDYHDALARARLRVLIGTAVNDLPGDFIVRLGRVLAEEHDAGHRMTPRLMLVPKDGDDAAPDCGRERAPLREERETACLQDKVRGLGAILEMLHAAHLDQRAYPASPALSAQVVEGLILAGRELVSAMAADA